MPAPLGPMIVVAQPGLTAKLRPLTSVRNRDVYLCGPTPLMESVRASLKALAVPASQVHLERFAY